MSVVDLGWRASALCCPTTEPLKREPASRRRPPFEHSALQNNARARPARSATSAPAAACQSDDPPLLQGGRGAHPSPRPPALTGHVSSLRPYKSDTPRPFGGQFSADSGSLHATSARFRGERSDEKSSKIRALAPCSCKNLRGVRHAACPISTGEGKRRVHLVRDLRGQPRTVVGRTGGRGWGADARRISPLGKGVYSRDTGRGNSREGWGRTRGGRG